jgi:MarR family
LKVDLRARTATVKVRGTGASWTFRLRWVDELTDRVAISGIVREAGASAPKPLLVYFKRASPNALRELRERRISFLGEQGSCFLFSPPLFVDVELPANLAPTPESSPPLRAETRNPFGRTGSRVLRWLLLHPQEEFTMHELARETRVSPTLISRVTRVLGDEAWIDLEPDPADRRVRRARMRRPLAALSAWGQSWDRRRIATQSWNLRSDSVEAMVRRLKRVEKSDPELRWAVGGLAGASLLERSAEPANVLLWVSHDHLAPLRDALAPTPSAGGHPHLRVATAPDDFIFDLSSRERGVPVADRVQLWLDCNGEGERALAAADAIAREMGW